MRLRIFSLKLNYQVQRMTAINFKTLKKKRKNLSWILSWNFSKFLREFLPGIVIILLLSYQHVFAGELSKGSSTEADPESSNSSPSEPIIMANACSSTLVDWVKDDYKDKTTFFGQIEFPSEAKSCTSSVRSYKEFIEKSGKKTSLSDTEAFSNYLAGRFPQVAPSAKIALSRCNSLPAGQDKIAKTRYYMAMEKLESYNTSLVDELAYIDSIVPENSGLSKIECNPQFPFPDEAKRCEQYKKKLASPCKVTPEQRMDELVKKTMIAMDQIDKLEKAYKKCISSIAADKCAAIRVVIDRINAENPWIDSGRFQQLKVITKNTNNWQNKIDPADVKKSIGLYFEDNRKLLTEQHASNLKHVRCLTNSRSDANSGCDFERTRALLASIPDIPDVSDKRISQNTEFSTHVQAEKCLIERGIDRTRTHDLVQDSLVTGGLTVATAGLSYVASGGLKVMQGMSTANRLRATAAGVTAVSAVNLGSGISQAYKSCAKESEAVIKFSSSPEALSQNVCPDLSSKLQLAKDAETNCLTDALLAGLDVWPFVKGIGLVGRQFSKRGLLDLYKDPKEREAVESILKKNGQLGETERKAAAETMLGRKLSEVEKNCVIQAHNIGAGKYMRTRETEELGVPLLSSAELLQKKSALSSCGFSVPDISLLMRAGITGGAPTNAVEFIRKASVKVLGRDLTPEQTSAVWDAASMRGADAAPLLKKAGFSDEEVKKIINGDLRKVSAADVKKVNLNESGSSSVNSGGGNNNATAANKTSTAAPSVAVPDTTASVPRLDMNDVAVRASQNPMTAKDAEAYVKKMAERSTSNYSKMLPSQQRQAQSDTLRDLLDAEVSSIYKLNTSLAKPGLSVAEKTKLEQQLANAKARCLGYDSIRQSAGWIGDNYVDYFKKQIARVCSN